MRAGGHRQQRVSCLARPLYGTSGGWHRPFGNVQIRWQLGDVAAERRQPFLVVQHVELLQRRQRAGNAGRRRAVGQLDNAPTPLEAHVSYGTDFGIALSAATRPCRVALARWNARGP